MNAGTTGEEPTIELPRSTVRMLVRLLGDAIDEAVDMEILTKQVLPSAVKCRCPMCKYGELLHAELQAALE